MLSVCALASVCPSVRFPPTELLPQIIYSDVTLYETGQRSEEIKSLELVKSLRMRRPGRKEGCEILQQPHAAFHELSPNSIE